MRLIGKSSVAAIDYCRTEEMKDAEHDEQNNHPNLGDQ
jgi:hypothetical protein